MSVLTLAAGAVEQLWDELLPLEVKELPADLAALDELLSDLRLLAPTRLQDAIGAAETAGGRRRRPPPLAATLSNPPPRRLSGGSRLVSVFMSECFCGCARKVPMRDRRLAKRGAEVRDLSAYIEGLTPKLTGASGWGWTDSDVDSFVAEGRQLMGLIAARIHGEPHGRGLDRGQLNEWLRSARDTKRHTAFFLGNVTAGLEELPERTPRT